MLFLTKVFYAGVIAALVVLGVFAGIRTIVPTPRQPPEHPASGWTSYPPGTSYSVLDQVTSDDPSVTDISLDEDFAAYLDDRADYRSKVFLAATVMGIVTILGGLRMPASRDAIRLGLMAGGLFTILSAMTQPKGNFAESGTGIIVLLFGAALFAILLRSGGCSAMIQVRTAPGNMTPCCS